jgi:hypothetical protein
MKTARSRPGIGHGCQTACIPSTSTALPSILLKLVQTGRYHRVSRYEQLVPHPSAYYLYSFRSAQYIPFDKKAGESEFLENIYPLREQMEPLCNNTKADNCYYVRRAALAF